MGDTSKHLTYFKVENFKRFESFEMNDLGQFNLILGDNNVGKTSVLEALLFDDKDDTVFLNNLFRALSLRKLKKEYVQGDIELYLNGNKESKNNHSTIKFQWITSTDVADSVEIQINKQQHLIFKRSRDVFKNPPYHGLYQRVQFYNDIPFPFIPFYKGHDEDLALFYSKLQQDRSLKKSFINSLKTLVPDLDDIELSIPYHESSPHLIMYQEHVNSSLPLALFGDGTLKMFRLLAEIIINRGSRLMIDEIDAGIHYSRFKEFWKTVLKTAYDNNVQLFMTTHNEECIKYFKEVLENDLPELKDKSRSITLIENPATREVKAFTYTFDQLEANIDVGNEIRGGAR